MDKVFNVGKLVDFQWKLGVSIASNHSSQLNTPFITVFVKVLDSNSEVTSHSFELTIPEFKNFAQQFKDMSNMIETL
ncbi:COMM domain-containing protein 6 [Dictyostelium discoideum AX4]|uniref:COMM domain-containing protein 6 n=2 Tax=Dictyostelium TaxID=5782 RepID=COMD6_DICDI|nr:COMM domain-containing protein 6 [Dictyostelium discoideum AX4]Q54MA5.2 RecName: Full=COMM domain-containing protein 6 [Dictyostelium discoideum]EAL64417.2 COMM domain-containing protein 6 [Dictyostelium discoideum AX4]|eukprot:XP_637929.2 COMM domain-containing protein 6 [Dictyostelium discoideum AX4]